MLKIFLGNTLTYSSLKKDGVHRKAMTLVVTSRNTLKKVTRKKVLTFRIN